MYRKRMILFPLLILFMILPSSFYAMEPLGDTGMFVNNTAMAPNVLIILDNSIDMSEKICSQAYNKNTNYCSQGCNNSCPYVNTSIYYKEDFSNDWKLLTADIGNLESGCTQGILAALNSQGFYDPYDDDCIDTYGDHTVCLNSHIFPNCKLECDYWQCMCGYHRVATGHYLNFKYCNKYSDTSCPTRYDYARQRLFEIVNDLGIDKDAPTTTNNQLMNLGLMSFATIPGNQTCRIAWCDEASGNSCGINKNEKCARNYQGGYVVAPIGTGYASCRAIPATSDFQRALNEVSLESSATAGMPLGEALAEAGLYFAGQSSWSFRRFGNGYTNRDYSVPQYISDHYNPSSYKASFIDESSMTYKSPINWRCQKNYVILLTAGNPKTRDEDGVFRAYKNYCAWSCKESYVQPTWNLFTGNQWRADGCQGYMKVWDANNVEQCLPIGNTGTSDWDASDVAGFLYNNDLLGGTADGPKNCSRGDKQTYFNDPDYPKQNITTFVIGFSDASQYGRDLMKSIARKGGSGNYYSITDQNDLDAALKQIFTSIMKNSAEYVSPVVPVSRQNGIYAGDSIYLGQFKTATDVPWIGNIKKYGLDTKGNILQNKKLGNAVIATCCDVDGNCNYTSSDISCTGASGDVYKDMIKDTSTSSWAVSGDGNNVQRGAAGRIVRDQALANARTVFTSKYTSSSLINIKTLTKEDLGVTTDLEKDEILSYVTGLSVGSVSNTDTNKLRQWYMGDIIHSRPVIMEDGINNVIFVGDNSGQLHCFVDDTSRADSTDALSEKWSFVPGEYWTKLSKIKNDRYPLYFVDGSPVIHDVGTERLLTFGFRRGGGSYVTLKIGTVDGNGNYSSDGYLTPSYKWNYPFTSGNETICGLGEKFGQSWLKPIPCNILTSITPKVSSNVLIVAGGYDAEAEDANDPSKPDKATNADSKGRGLYAIYADTGLPFVGFVNSSNLQIPGSIVDVLPYDRTGDGNVDTIYAGDMNGNVYVFWNWIKNATTSTYEDSLSWQMRRIFTGRDTRGNGKGMILKFFQAPDVVMENYYSYSCPGTSPVIKVSTPLDYVFIGSGDREHPKAAQKVSGSTQTNDRLYGIRHLFYDYTACPTAATYPLYDKSSGFYDVTNAFDSASTTFNKDETNLHYGLLTYGSALNWYIVFNDKDDTNNTIYGEKVISQPIVFDGVAYFTTYIPPKAVYKKECGFDCGSHCGDSDGWCKQDKCKPTELGKTRVYAVDYRNGKPVYSKDTAEGFASRDGTEGHRFIKKDRWVAEGIGMSSQPTLIVTKDGPVLLIATSKGVLRINTDEIKKRKKGQKSYWMIK